MTFRRRSARSPRAERGVALLVALFALMLLSAIGLGMMYSADTETSINFNYKDKQAAIYAASAGVEEAKDRLLMTGAAAGDKINPPTDLPSTSAANIIYLINPSSGETVAPWDYTNTYADTELCHDSVMGLTGTAGIPCSGSSSLPSGSTWRSVVDNSAVGYTGLFKLSPPLNYKWVRIQLKTNNTTPFPVDGNSANSGQVCWDGMHQIPLPTGYNASCVPKGGISSIVVTNPGSGYPASPPPTITISAPSAGGTQATATANMTITAGSVTQITVNNAGSGYDPAAPPLVTIAAPAAGTTATATASVVPSGGAVTAVTLSNTPTACYANAAAATPTISGGGGSGASAAATMTTTQCVTAITISNSGSGCGSNGTYTVAFTGGASAQVTVQGNKVKTSSGYSVVNPGSGYNAAPSVTTGGTLSCSTAPTITPVMGYQVASVTGGTALCSGCGGSGYSSAPTVNFGLAPGTTPTATATYNATNPNAGQIAGFTVTSGGTGYTSTPAVTVAAPLSGTTATATANINATAVVSSITVNNEGAGYLAQPTVTIAPPGGSGTTAAAIARVQSGAYYSPVILLTALGQTARGGRAMMQAEVAYSIRSLALPGALTMAGPQPNYGSPNSNNFYISGVDHPNGYSGTDPLPAGCDSTPATSHPSIGVYDDPNNPTDPSSVDTILAPGVLQPAPTHYPGISAAPDIQNVYGALGDQGTTPAGMESLVAQIAAIPGANVIPSGTLSLGSMTYPAINVNYGDLTLSGNNTGYGVLVVTGTLTFAGNFTWNGIVLVIGEGDIEFSGGGGGTINGSVLIAKTRDGSGNLLSELGSPTLDWSGGGGNGIYYDHCWADGMLNMIPLTMPSTPDPLKVLSLRTISY